MPLLLSSHNIPQRVLSTRQSTTAAIIHLPFAVMIIYQPLIIFPIQEAQLSSAMLGVAPCIIVQGIRIAHRAYRGQRPEKESFLEGPRLEVPPYC